MPKLLDHRNPAPSGVVWMHLHLARRRTSCILSYEHKDLHLASEVMIVLKRMLVRSDMVKMQTISAHPAGNIAYFSELYFSIGRGPRKMKTTSPTLIPFINSAVCSGRRHVKMSTTCMICLLITNFITL